MIFILVRKLRVRVLVRVLVLLGGVCTGRLLTATHAPYGQKKRVRYSIMAGSRSSENEHYQRCSSPFLPSFLPCSLQHTFAGKTLTPTTSSPWLALSNIKPPKKRGMRWIEVCVVPADDRLLHLGLRPINIFYRITGKPLCILFHLPSHSLSSDCQGSVVCLEWSHPLALLTNHPRCSLPPPHQKKFHHSHNSKHGWCSQQKQKQKTTSEERRHHHAHAPSSHTPLSLCDRRCCKPIDRSNQIRSAAPYRKYPYRVVAALRPWKT